MEAKILVLGDRALTVEFGNQISIEINKKVNALKEIFLKRPVDGIIELVATYRSLTIHYQPDIIRYEQLVQVCKEYLEQMDVQGEENTDSRIIEIPVLYGGKIGEDLEEVASYHKMTPQEVIEAHTKHLNRVYMIGFWPGMAYMEAENGMSIPRRPSPKQDVCQGAIIVQETQSIVLPNNTPTGWYIIGHTPLRPFDLRKKDPSLFHPGDWVRFSAIEKPAYEEIKKQVEEGTYQIKAEEV